MTGNLGVLMIGTPQDNFEKFPESLWPAASSNEKNSNDKHVPKNWKLDLRSKTCSCRPEIFVHGRNDESRIFFEASFSIFGFSRCP
jgi:hypothetical protein